MDNTTFIAFDFGTKKMGIAVGQTITMTATPLSSLRVEKGIPRWEEVTQLVEDWQPAGFVVGIPRNMDGSASPITQKTKTFITQLKEKYCLPVFEIDERLTTVEARQQMFESGGYKALREISVDSFAAKLILEAWMRTKFK